MKTLAGDDSPHSVALGSAVGLFIGMTPTLGVQMVLAVVAATILKANRAIAVALVWISNPITILPMLYVYYRLGALILGVPVWTFDNFSGHSERLISLGFTEALGAIGWELGYPILVGSLIMAIVAGAAAYPITFVLVKRAKARSKGSDAARAPLALIPAFILAVSCSDSAPQKVPSGAAHRVPAEVSLFLGTGEGRVDLVLAPAYLQSSREEMALERFSPQLGIDPQTHRLAVLWVINREDEEGRAFELSATDAILKLVGPSGEFSDVAPSQMDPRGTSGVVIGNLSMLGAERRVIADGTAHRILVWLPNTGIDECLEAEVLASPESIDLEKTTVSAEAWAFFTDDLDLAHFRDRKNP